MIRQYLRQLTITTAVLLGTAFTATAQGAVRGTVTDSIRGGPLRGATIVATPSGAVHDSLFHSATTDDRGRFVMTGLRDGAWILTVEHPFIDSTSIGVPPQDVTIRANDTAAVKLAIPSPATLRSVLCPAATTDSAIGVLLGVVRGQDGAPRAGAHVVISWSDFDVDRVTAVATPKQNTVSVAADSLGIYRACGLPVARTLFLQAQAGASLQSGVIEEQIAESRVLVRDFHVSAVVARPVAAVAVADSGAPLGNFFITGKVVDTDGRPIRSATVQLFGTTRAAQTGDDGHFRLGGLPGGTQGLEVIALGFYPRRLRAEVSAQTEAVTVRLERAAAVLDSVRVIAKRVNSPNAMAYREFDERLKNGQGAYITEAKIDSLKPFAASDLYRMLPGYTVTQPRAGLDAMLVSSHGNGFNSTCVMNIFLNGVMVQPTDLNIVNPNAIHGIEIYQVATAPAKYKTQGNCGVVLIWTK